MGHGAPISPVPTQSSYKSWHMYQLMTGRKSIRTTSRAVFATKRGGGGKRRKKTLTHTSRGLCWTLNGSLIAAGCIKWAIFCYLCLLLQAECTEKIMSSSVCLKETSTLNDLLLICVIDLWSSVTSKIYFVMKIWVDSFFLYKFNWILYIFAALLTLPYESLLKTVLLGFSPRVITI